MDVVSLIVEFYSKDRGGRATLPTLWGGLYRPHLVIDGDSHEKYLGVQIITCASSEAFNVELAATAKLPYQGIDYSKLVPGASFKIKEGAKTVGEGRVGAF